MYERILSPLISSFKFEYVYRRDYKRHPKPQRLPTTCCESADNKQSGGGACL